MKAKASKWEDPAKMEDFFEECIKLNEGDDTLELDFSIFGTQPVDETNKVASTSIDNQIDTDEEQDQNESPGSQQRDLLWVNLGFYENYLHKN